MRMLRAADHRRMPWKNGGGETTEIAVVPEGAGLDAFAWRVSMARVAEDGPFSVFPGIDRTLSLVEGAAMELTVAGQGVRVLTPASPPFPFPADAPTTARLPGGPILDLNVMTRRGGHRHAVRRETPKGQATFTGAGAATLLLLLGPCRLDAGDGAAVAATRFDAALLAPGEACTVTAGEGAAGLFVIDIDADA